MPKILFATTIERLTHEEEAWCRSTLEEMTRHNEFAPFSWRIGELATGDSGYLFISDSFAPEPMGVASFVQGFLARFRPGDCWAMTWSVLFGPRATPCSGGAIFVTSQTIESVDASRFAAERLEAFRQARQATDPETSP